MRLHIYQQNNGREYTLDIDKHCTVLQLKEVLIDKHGVSATPAQQQLWLAGYELQDRSQIASAGVTEGSMLELVIEYSESLLLSVAFFLLAASAAGCIASYFAWRDSFTCEWVGHQQPLYVGRGGAQACKAVASACRGWLPPLRNTCPSFSKDACTAVLWEPKPLSAVSRSLDAWCRVESTTIAAAALDPWRAVHLTWQTNSVMFLASLVCGAVALSVAAWLVWRFQCHKDPRLLSEEIRMRLLPHCREIDPEAV